MADLLTTVADRRAAAGLTVTALAAQAGLSRQALSAIEAGRSTPSTAVALRLARALGCAVDDLFALPPAPLPSDLPVGARVVLGQVHGAWVSHRLDPHAAAPADGLVTAAGVEPLVPLDALARRVLVAGCAPILGALVPRAGGRWLPRSSGAALRALAEGRTHVAGLHLAPLDDPGAHDALIRAALPDTAVEVVTLVGWREGLALAPGNPLGVAAAADLAGLRVARRTAGSGAARVLAAALAPHGLRVEGPRVDGHLDAALAVRHGAADAAVVIEPVAEALGLPFVPLSEERFELVVRQSDHAHAGLARLLDALADARFAREVRCMGAYDTAAMGARRRVEAA